MKFRENETFQGVLMGASRGKDFCCLDFANVTKIPHLDATTTFQFYQGRCLL